MDPSFKILPDAVGVIEGASKQAILAAAADRFAAVYGVNRTEVLESLEEREALGSTGFGRGVAIPHARTAELNRPAAVLLKLTTPVDFGAADGRAVDVVFALLSPVNAGASHLHALAAMSRILRDEDTHEAITESQDAETIYALLTNVADRDVA